MSRHIVVAPGRGVSGRWREAFDDVVVVDDPVSAVRRATPETVFWASASDPASLHSLRRARPELPLVAITLNPDAEEGLRMLESGAVGYCHVLAAPGLLQQVDVVVRNGGLWVGPDLMARAVVATSRLQGGKESDPMLLDRLTPREREVAGLVVHGASNKEIAQVLGISLRTVKAHMGAMFEKLGVRDRLQLVLAVRKADSVGRAA